MRDRLRIVPTILQALAEIAEPRRDLGGQLLRAEARLERVRSAEDQPQFVEAGGLAQVVEAERQGAPDSVRPVGVTMIRSMSHTAR